MSGMGIHAILINIMSCHRFSKSETLTVILKWISTLVPYYLNKVFLIVETEEGGADNIKITTKEKINAVNLYNKDSLLT